MEKEAIEQIQTSANIPALIEHLNAAGTQNPVVALPENVRLHDLEKFMAHASHFRLKYATTSINDFIEYSQGHAYAGSTCFVNAEAMTARAIFDLGVTCEPGHKQHTASLSLTKTAAFTALTKFNGQQHSQKDAAEFIEDWCDYISYAATMSNAEMSPHQAAAKLRDLTIEAARELNSKVSDFGHEMSAMERIEAKGKDTIPSVIKFDCVPYRGIQTRCFTLRIGILTGEDKPKIVFRITQLESTQEEIAEEFKDILVSEFTESSLTTYIGEA
ncbi:DUF2303 family protein [Aestuariicella hydrocarbonica]|uniref:DUF2303 family protein n=1 Tax=Pseudomaricurvus hydrocarbonicus TaxID=1470433 RepID=A0A9E5JST1_9GAMM|nr:DUF2303 family protein [Aestuariicella hydrocarbonica]NHO64654.1 DUF2303 family protein [Aestuariicella hydrocarbonica]